jgi:hypothetical protein
MSSTSQVAVWRRDWRSKSSLRLAAVLRRFRSQVSSLFLFSTSSAQPTRVVSRVVGCAGGTMLIKLALALLATWLVGILFFSNAGDVVHILLLVGLGLLLLGFLRARDEATRRTLGDK